MTRLFTSVVPLRNLFHKEDGAPALSGRFVRVRNAAVVNHIARDGTARAAPLGDALPDESGNFLFQPGRGGGRIDKVLVATEDVRRRYDEAARFGEVNAYYHVDRMAGYLDGLLKELSHPSLPPVTVVVNAHHAAVERCDGRDGRLCPDGRYRPFQGGHYRLPGPTKRLLERAAVSPTGEIHLGPGQNLLTHGALCRLVGGGYRANASHNAGIIYHEYGHHVSRHTADFCGNAARPPEAQSNRKAALDEGFADYFTAVLLGTPDIWFFHHRHDEGFVHRRSLRSSRTMADYRGGARADPHDNGTIWAAALWELRTCAVALDPRSGRSIDRLAVATLLLLGREARPSERRRFAAAGLALREAALGHRWFSELIDRVLSSRGLDRATTTPESDVLLKGRATC